MDKLYTSKEIADIYGVTQYTVTQNWGNKGLKKIRGAGNSYLFKKEWVDEFIEEQIIQSNVPEINVIKVQKPKLKRNNKNIQFVI